MTALALASAAGGRGGVTTDIEAEGTHYRVETEHGAVHLFRPAGYDRRRLLLAGGAVEAGFRSQVTYLRLCC